MGKQYLNREEKNQALTLAAFIGYLDEKAEEWAKRNLDKTAIKYLRMAKSFAGKTLDYLFEGLDPTERGKVVVELRKMDIVCKYKDQAVRDYKKMMELDSVTPVKTDDLMEICSQALGICGICKDTDPASCRLRKIFITYDIPVAEEDPLPGGCPYKI